MRKRALVVIAGAIATALGIFECLSACDTGSAASPRGPVPPGTGDNGGLDATTDAGCRSLVLPNKPFHVTGTVVEALPPDAAPDLVAKPVPGAMIAVEYGGLYLDWCDLSKASPFYVFGAVADDAGRFEIDVRQGTLGFHSFADGYYYTRAGLDTDAGKTVALRMEVLPDAQAQPTIADAGFRKAEVSPGEEVTFSAYLATWNKDGGDPLSDESVLVEPTQSWCLELDPPARGTKDNFPDGLWKRTFNAPTTPGTYTYWFSATTSQCVSTNLVRVTLTVK